MANLDVLDSTHAIYASHRAAWVREERRLQGGDAVLSELVAFAYEETDSHDARKAWARWVNFAKAHTSTLSGHLRRAMPLPNFGEGMDEVRTREEIDTPTLAELFYYNCDGVGNDGSQLPAFMDGVEQRALATGFRWLMVEMPSQGTLDAIRLRDGRQPREGEVAPTTDEDVRQGFRPFLVEYSPLSVTNWRYRDGVLVWAVIRIPVEADLDFGKAEQTGDGYYLLVRAGYQGLGHEFTEGGWWKYDAQKAELDHQRWLDTDGQIPMWMHIGEPGTGTFERPSIGQSSTMELGQISADLMNAVSEQRFNLRQAAKSVNYWRGMRQPEHELVRIQLADGSIHVAVPPSQNPDGTWSIPELSNSAQVLLDSEAFQFAISGALNEAKEIMVRQITAGPDASGARVEADHAQHTAPLLARISATAEQSWNTMLYFVARRFGIQRPTASIQLPREYELRNVLDSIDAMLLTIETNGVQSPTWKRALAIRKGDELDLLPEEKREAIEGELEEQGDERARLELSKLRAEVAAAWMLAGASEEGAAKEAGLEPAEVSALGFGQEETPEVQPGAGAQPVPRAEGSNSVSGNADAVVERAA